MQGNQPLGKKKECYDPQLKGPNRLTGQGLRLPSNKLGTSGIKERRAERLALPSYPNNGTHKYAMLSRLRLFWTVLDTHDPAHQATRRFEVWTVHKEEIIAYCSMFT